MNKKRSQQERDISHKRNTSKGKSAAKNIEIKSIKGTSDDQFLILFDLSPVAMSLATIPEGKAIYVNQAWLDLIGITDKESVLGKTSVELGLIPDVESRESILNEFKQNGSVKNAHIVAKVKNGTRINLLVNVKVVEIDGVEYLFSTNENITKLKQAEELIHKSQTTLSELVERAPFGIYIVDSNFCIAQMNIGSQKGAFRNVRPVIGRDFREAMHILWPNNVAEGIISAFRHTLDTGEPYYSPPFINPRHDVEIVEAYEWELQRIMLPEGQYGVICYYFDSTPIRAAERVARESDEKYRKIVDTAGEGIIISDLEGHFQFVNQTFADMLGYPLDELIGKKSHDFMYDEQQVVQIIQSRKHLQKGKVLQDVMRWHHKNGLTLWTLFNASPLYDLQGNHSGNLVLHTDITERKQIEDALRISEERFRSVLDNSVDCIYRFNIQTSQYEYISPSVINLVGYTPEELLSQDLKQSLLMIDPVFIPVLQEAQTLSEKTGKAKVEYRQKAKNGEYKWISNHMAVEYDSSGKPLYRDGNLRDITAHRQDMEVLFFQARLLSEVYDAVFSSDSNFTITYWNNAAEKMFGWTADEVIGKNSGELLKPIVYGSSRTKERSRLRNEGHWEGEVQYIRKDGTYFFADVNSTILKDSNENFKNNIIVCRDITEAKKLRDALSESEEKFRTIVETANEGICIVDENRNTTYTNFRMASMLGYTVEEMLTKPWQTFVNETEIQGTNARIVKRKSGFGGSESYEYKLKHKDGTLVWVIVNACVQYDNEERYLGSVNIVTDISYLKQKELELKELITTKDKFFNIIAHDLKNPFTSLIGSTELLVGNIDRMGHEQVKTLAYIINASSKNGYGILLNLLDWSRSQTGMLKINPESVNLHKLIDEQILALSHISSNKEIEIISLVKKDIHFTADKDILSAVLRNLISNALKYSHRKGLVTIRASLKYNRYIITIQDNGTGISPEKLKNIFTLETKISTPGTEKEQGTGLGLKLCKELIEKIGGEIWVDSTENKGSEFKFSIPLEAKPNHK